jgi:hypothetical protein
MNSSKNNKRGGYYWNQSAPCSEEEVGRLMLENIKLLLQKKESDIDIGQVVGKKEHGNTEVKIMVPLFQASRHSAGTSINIQALEDAGWEISKDKSGRQEYNHFAFPFREDLTVPPTEEEIGTARNQYKRDVRNNIVNGFRNRADNMRLHRGYLLSTISKERMEKQQQQQQQQQQQRQQQQPPRQASALPQRASAPTVPPASSQASPQRASAPPVQQDIDKNKELINNVLRQIPNLQIQELESQIVNVSFQLADLPADQYNSVITGIAKLRETFLPSQRE